MVRSDTLNTLVNLSSYAKQHEADRIVTAIHKAPPDFVICNDDDAIQWVCLRLEVPSVIILSGISGDPCKYLLQNKIDSLTLPGHNITGVYRTSYFAQSLALLKQVMPQAEAFAVLTDTSTSGLTLLNGLKTMDQSLLPMKWSRTLMSSEIVEWEAKLKEWYGQMDAVLILSANSLRDENGQILSVESAARRLAATSKIPEAVSWAFQVRSGLFISATDDARLQGRYTAMQLVKVLKGETPARIPFVTPPNGVPAINISRAGQLDLRVPQEVVNLMIDTGKVYQ